MAPLTTQRSLLSTALDTAPSLRSVEAAPPGTPLQPSMAMRQLYRKVGVGQGAIDADDVAAELEQLEQRVLDGAGWW